MALQTRTLLVGALAGLLIVMFVGGAALALVERVGYLQGVWLAFAVISTTGFGEGPRTTGGALLAMLIFALGAVQWFGVMVAAFELSIIRAGRWLPEMPPVQRASTGGPSSQPRRSSPGSGRVVGDIDP